MRRGMRTSKLSKSGRAQITKNRQHARSAYKHSLRAAKLSGLPLRLGKLGKAGERLSKSKKSGGGGRGGQSRDSHGRWN